jgi:DNA-directed RNA polymerase subunit RPC12/RpoP
MNTSNCLNCGKEFIKTKSNQYYCCLQCGSKIRYNKRKLGLPTRPLKTSYVDNIDYGNCLNCGKFMVITRPDKKFCSSKCGNNYIRNL